MKFLALSVLLAGCGGEISTGTELWDAGNVEGARQHWEQVADTGNPSPTLRYNLGNAWFRKGDIPRAIGWWRSAGLWSPRDADISHNLAFARSQLENLPPPVAPATGWTEFLSPGEMGAMGLLVAGGGTFGAVLTRRRKSFVFPWVFVAVFGVVLSMTALSGWNAQNEKPLAVVVDGVVGVRPDPMVDAAVGFELAAGTEVRIEARRDEFVLVETGEGKRGWIPEVAAMILLP